MAAVTEQLADGVLTLTINLPERSNPLTFDVLSGLLQGVRAAGQSEDVRVILVTGAGGRAFSAGGDLKAMDGEAAPGDPFLHGHNGRRLIAELITELYECGVPTVAKVAGYALAGGFGLMLACDYVIATDDSVFGTPEIDVGLWPFMITVPMLRSMPPKTALDLMLTGRRVDAAEALAIGFVNRVVPRTDLDATVEELVARLRSKPADVVRLGRSSFYAALDLGARDALQLLHPLLTVTLQTQSAQDGLAAFSSGRSSRA